MKRILANCGSTRSESAKLKRLRVMAQWAGSQSGLSSPEGLPLQRFLPFSK